jgi:hypothetical protein
VSFTIKPLKTSVFAGSVVCGFEDGQDLLGHNKPAIIAMHYSIVELINL